MSKILIVDDEPGILDIVSMTLKHEGYDVDTCLDGFEAIEKIKNNGIDLVLLDIKMPKMDGIEVLEKIKEINQDIVVIMISGHGNIETAVESTKKGAYHFIVKPPDLHEMKLIIRNAIDFQNSKNEIKKLKEELIESNKLIGNSTHIRAIGELIKKYANTDSNVLITGESGSGKFLVARQIHLNSPRSALPFININCAGITDTNLESELFGKYYNNTMLSPGKLTEAKGGTILFDEITNLSPEVQSKLLKLFEDNKYSVTGSTDELLINTRFIFTTNKDLNDEINEKRLREDLYHRINVLRIDILPLRERPEDIADLVKYYTGIICRTNNFKVKHFSDEALNFILSLRWPGNVRELRNLIERLIFSVDEDVIDVEDIEIPETKHTKILNELINKNMALNDFQNESEKIFILKMLNDYKHNITQTSEALKIQRSHLYKLMNKYNIPLPSKIKPE